MWIMYDVGLLFETYECGQSSFADFFLKRWFEIWPNCWDQDSHSSSLRVCFFNSHGSVWGIRIENSKKLSLSSRDATDEKVDLKPCTEKYCLYFFARSLARVVLGSADLPLTCQFYFRQYKCPKIWALSSWKSKKYAFDPSPRKILATSLTRTYSWQYFFRRGADVKLHDRLGNTVLHEVAQQIVNKPADVPVYLSVSLIVNMLNVFYKI